MLIFLKRWRQIIDKNIVWPNTGYTKDIYAYVLVVLNVKHKSYNASRERISNNFNNKLGLIQMKLIVFGIK